MNRRSKKYKWLRATAKEEEGYFGVSSNMVICWFLCTPPPPHLVNEHTRMVKGKTKGVK